MNPLLAWLDDPSPQRGIRFAASGDEWEHWSYADLAARARATATALRTTGVGRDDVVTIVQRAGPQFVASLFGAMLAGAVPSPVAPPLAFQDTEAYRAHLLGMLGRVRPQLLLVDRDEGARIDALTRGASRPRLVEVEGLLDQGAGDAAAALPAAAGAPSETALLQFTSGSSGRPRGVRIRVAALAANVAAIRRWLAMTEDDATATWLPVHHDMGLIGCLITPIVNRSDIWILPPERFVRSPLRYLRCFGQHGARLTAMPAFGLEYVARRVRPESLHGLDFSSWRTLIVGAERVRQPALDAFERLLAPHGFRRRAFMPAYGLAEATLAVTGVSLDDEPRSITVDPASLRMGAAVGLADSASGEPLVGCGRPLAGVEVRVVDGAGAALGPGTLGEIVVRGPSLGSGYAGAAGDSPSLTAFVDGELRTGDAGLLIDGELFVIGRLGDSVKVRGATVFAEDAEAALVGAGLPPDRLAVVLGADEGRPVVLALLEGARPGWGDLAYRTTARLVPDARVVVLDVRRGTIVRTSSGKPRRRDLWTGYLAGDLTGRTRADGVSESAARNARLTAAISRTAARDSDGGPK
jgi:acyl-CoA synthetase (AMP-forming)/AMP-acid ligase II